MRQGRWVALRDHGIRVRGVRLAVLARRHVRRATGAGTLGSTFFGAGAIVFLPIFYGVLGFVMTLVGATLFNVVVGITGGIEVDVS